MAHLTAMRELLKEFLGTPENQHIILYAADLDDNKGICIKCRTLLPNIEPDAECYYCPHCEHTTVYGAENLLIRL